MSHRPLDRWIFGKLPSHGDFVSRGLDFGLRDALDHWLAEETRLAQDRFGEELEARWFAAPAWCFVDRDADGLWSGGALCASIDSAGRKYPAVMAVPVETHGDAGLAAGGCLEVLYAALAGRWDVDRLHAAPIVPTRLGWDSDSAAWALLAEDGTSLVEAGRFPSGIVPRMLEMAA